MGGNEFERDLVKGDHGSLLLAFVITPLYLLREAILLEMGFWAKAAAITWTLPKRIANYGRKVTLPKA